MGSSPLFLGLDCGGSSTRALVWDDKGAAVFRGQAGAANIASTPPEQISEHLRKALSGAPEADYVCGCFAGLMTSDDRERAVRLLSQLCPGAKVAAEPDYMAALAASPSHSDVTVIAGTGSLVCSRVGDRIVKSGGRGYVLGDYGSAFRYGREVLRFFLDGAESPTPNPLPHLRAKVREGALEQHFGSKDPQEVIANLYRGGGIASKLARLAPSFVEMVTGGDESARAFLSQESARLASVVVGHVQRHFSERERILTTLSGGLWTISPVFRSELMSQLNVLDNARAYGAELLKRPPVEGAVILAQALANP